MKDHKYYNHNETHEAQYHLRKNQLRQTQKNIDTLNNIIIPPYTSNKEVDDIILKNLDKFEKAC